MNRQTLIAILGAFSIMLSFASCKQKSQASAPAQETPKDTLVVEVKQHIKSNGIYHWKTTFNLNQEETDFLGKNNVSRMYVRFFDVDVESSPMANTRSAVPVGTTRFMTAKPDSVEIVPTVFITVKTILLCASNSASVYDLASKIYTRVMNMADYNDMGPVHEIQLDCDWTTSTMDAFYSLCQAVRTLARKDSLEVSSTIRLHQLRQDPPPVDKGVLMVYNTGDIRSQATSNSILDLEDVYAYLNGKPISYSLPLDIALPVYGWGVLFRDGAYTGILHHSDFNDSGLYKRGNGDSYTVRKDHMLDGRQLLKGDVIRREYPDAEEIDKAARRVAASFKDTVHDIILYHLDSDNLSKYSDDEISRFYSY